MKRLLLALSLLCLLQCPAQGQTTEFSLLPNRFAPTFVAATATFTPPASATDIICIFGSSTKVIQILRIEFGMTQTTAGIVPIYVIKRKTVDSGGTSVAATCVPFDIHSEAASATVNTYTVLPSTIGTAIGNVMVKQLLIPAPASIANASNILFDAELAGEPLVLRSATDCLAINLGGSTPTGAAGATATITWIEK